MINFHTHIVQSNAIINGNPDNELLRYSIGIHPWNTASFDNAQWLKIKQLAELPQVLMIGETGIDKLRGASIDIQQQVFTQHIELSESLKKPLILHCVRAYQEIVQLHRSMKPQQPWILHGFRGNAKIAAQLNREGIYLSFGEHYNIDALRTVNLNMLFIESDDSATPISTIYSNIANDLNITIQQLNKLMARNLQAINISNFE